MSLLTGSAAVDSVTGTVTYADINPGDVPTVKTAFDSFTYQNAGHTDVTATLTAAQLAAIHAVEVPLVVVQDPAGINHGVATWTYSIADGAFDFLAAGEVLTLTYMAQVDNNFAPNNETDVQDVHDHDHRHQRRAGHHDQRAADRLCRRQDHARRRSDRARSDQRDADVQGSGSHRSPHGCRRVEHGGARRRRRRNRRAGSAQLFSDGAYRLARGRQHQFRHRNDQLVSSPIFRSISRISSRSAKR